MSYILLVEQTAPAAPSTAQVLLYPKADGLMYTKDDAGTERELQAGAPVGSVVAFAGTAAPTDWLLCYGQAVSRTTYAALFAVISTTYGVGDGSTTFNLPDLRGRVVAGQDDMGGVSADRLTDQSGGLDGDVLGDTGGAETHTLLTAETPAHTHAEGFLSDGQQALGALGNNAGNQGASGDTNTGSTGGDGAHNNVQPTIILNYIIKT